MNAASTPSPYSNTKFGWFMAAVCVAISVNFAFKHAWRPSEALAVLAAVTALVAVVRPGWLAPFNRFWFQIGLWMSKITNPLVMGLLFFVIITPLAIVARWSGRDALAVRRKNRTSYWVDRESAASDASESFKHQF